MANEGMPSGPPGSGGLRIWILAPLLAWLAVGVVLLIYFDQRGRWTILSGTEGYRDCFGAPPPANFRLVRCEALRHYRLTGEMLAMECYVRAEGDFDTSGSDWKGAPALGETGRLPRLLRDAGLTRVPAWFSLGPDGRQARVMRSGGGRLLSIYPAGKDGILIAGGWLTKNP
jgi:hypothetical protein